LGNISSWAIIGLIIGALAGALWIVPLAKERFDVLRKPEDARLILQKFVPNDAYFSNLTSIHPILTAFHIDGRPLEFAEGSPDLNQNGKEISMLDALVASMSDPFIYESYNGIMSGIIHASPPTFIGI